MVVANSKLSGRGGVGGEGGGSGGGGVVNYLVLSPGRGMDDLSLLRWTELCSYKTPMKS